MKHIATQHPRIEGEEYVDNWNEVDCPHCLAGRPRVHWLEASHPLGIDDLFTTNKEDVWCALCQAEMSQIAQGGEGWAEL